MEVLLQQMKQLENRVRTRSSPTLHKDARRNLGQHLLYEYEAQLKRFKITQYKLMNKPTKPRSHSQKITSPRDIANEFSEFYHKLYNLKDDPQLGNPPPQVIDSFLGSISIPSLSEAQLKDLNSPFTEQEILGYSNEYLKVFQSILRPHICASFNQAM